MNRRVGFFAIAAVVCLLLRFLVKDELRWVPTLVGSLYVLLTVLALADALGRRRL